MPGGDWERCIGEGLEWTGERPGEGRFVLLMTPHSVRRAGGCCLNELARAMARGLPIVPVMVATVEPPLSIARLTPGVRSSKAPHRKARARRRFAKGAVHGARPCALGSAGRRRQRERCPRVGRRPKRPKHASCDRCTVIGLPAGGSRCGTSYEASRKRSSAVASPGLRSGPLSGPTESSSATPSVPSTSSNVACSGR
jgi:hypothetical protein